MKTQLNCFTTSITNDIIPIHPVKKSNFDAWLAAQSTADQTWLRACGITADATKAFLIPTTQGKIDKVIYIAEEWNSRWSFAGLPSQLSEGNYQFIGLTPQEYKLAAIGWGLAKYIFSRYKTPINLNVSKLVLPETISANMIEAEVAATYWVRDLVNTPAEDMGPAQLGEAAESLVKQYGGKLRQFIGDELLQHNFPAIYAVGRGSINAPRLIDLTWGDESAPKITLVGKGVCFDSGGLDLKNSSNMRLMKKDMGGAAHVLGLAQWIMSSQLPIRLRVIIAAVENMVSGNAYRPGDVVSTRKGLTIEIGNTDAEGRVVLADALALACEDNPSLIIDFATLTGAARVALGSEIPNLFSNDVNLAQKLQAISAEHDDLSWHMPLYKPYRDLIDSPLADICNDSSSPYGGALTATLFLNEFVTPTIPWVHLDINAWNNKARPGRPEGGEAMGIRMVYGYLSG